MAHSESIGIDLLAKQFTNERLDRMWKSIVSLKNTFAKDSTDESKETSLEAAKTFFGNDLLELIPDIDTEELDAAIKCAVQGAFCSEGEPKDWVMEMFNEDGIAKDITEKLIIIAISSLLAGATGSIIVSILVKGATKYLADLLATEIAKVIDKGIEGELPKYCKTTL